jgi:hypothetical protein
MLGAGVACTGGVNRLPPLGLMLFSVGEAGVLLGAGSSSWSSWSKPAVSRLPELTQAAVTKDGTMHFRAGAYQPGTPEGDWLIAHELAHVVQQRGAGGSEGEHLHRRSVFESIGILLGLEEGNWTDQELRAYLDILTSSGHIDGSYDADNKARAIVRKWKQAAPGGPCCHRRRRSHPWRSGQRRRKLPSDADRCHLGSCSNSCSTRTRAPPGWDVLRCGPGCLVSSGTIGLYDPCSTLRQFSAETVARGGSACREHSRRPPREPVPTGDALKASVNESIS